MPIRVKPLTKYEERWNVWRDEMVLLNEQNTRLLAVARAAKAAVGECEHGWAPREFCASCHGEKDRALAEALAAVEDLL